jgi:predicted permease
VGMNDFLVGVLVTTSVAAAAFFWRFWKKTRDRFFALFAFAFLLMALNRFGLLFISEEHEASTALYVVRLVSFVLILVAIVDKNRSPRRGR